MVIFAQPPMMVTVMNVDLIQDFMWGSKIMETLWILIINLIITFIVGAWMFRYFDFVFNTQADLNDSVARIIEGLTTQVNDLDEGEFINLIRKGIKELIGYFEGNVDSINEDIIHFFAFDFITQTLNFRYGAVYQNKIDEFDPMFN